ncbi:sugar ABC transporter permease [Microbacterium sp. ABRD28]|uniref:carbohydrate ABC transporter permease n=1 Tax=Microbacterium sp. ABRD28 TaxID=2268461 RepID=UPI000F555098|nr:sugar ABC transporter permease [Microbacterium sp. ABRD28]AZC14965.1 sugar ABC transporter permease [Microbacterium sp. ABRD28]
MVTQLQAPPVSSPAGSASALPAGPRPRRRVTRRTWPFIIPSIVLICVFFTVPFLLNLPFAFSSWTGYSSDIALVGLSNFELLASRGILWTSTAVTVVYAVICMLVQNVVSLSLAFALRDNTWGNTFFRSLFFLPVLISPLAGGYIWRAILDPEGPLNAAIGVVVPGFSFAWLGDPVWALFSVAFVDAWKWCGIATLVYIAGINSVPRELLEAAEIDGAPPWTRFWKVTFPLLAPAFTFNVVTTLIGALTAYDVVASMTQGGPGDSTSTLNFAVVQQFGYSFFGVASSLNLFVTLLVIVVAIPLVSWLRRREISA